MPNLRRGKPLPLKLRKVTEADLIICRDLILQGVTPQTAVCRVREIHPKTYNRWMEEGSSPDSPPAQREFFLAVKRAAWTARAVAESRVWGSAPDAWLMRGPGGRSTKDEPGWSEEAKQQQPINLNLFDVACQDRPAGSGDEAPARRGAWR